MSGRGGGSGDEILSGIPGTRYSDGSFEFQNVSTGFHTIVKVVGDSVTAGAVVVGNRDVDNVVLQRPQLFPAEYLPAPLANGALIESKALAMVTILGQVLDETSKEPLYGGAVTLTGYGGTQRTFAIVAGEGYKIPGLLPGTYHLTINVSVTVGLEDLKLDLTARKETP